MISYPPPEFEEQKSEILQRYQILSENLSEAPMSLANSLAMAVKAPIVIAALNGRYRGWYRCEHGCEIYSSDDLQSYFARMHLSQTRFAVADIGDEEFFLNYTQGLKIPRLKSVAGVPLTDPNGKRLGTLCVADTEPRELDPASLDLLTSFGQLISNDICMRSAARYAVRDLIELEREKCDLFELATIDPLTKALNRRAFLRFSERELARFQRDKAQIATLMLDIDHFKSVNDEYGHAAGDRVLSKLVSVASTALRKEDLVGRLGGEEFAILLVDADAREALNVANRIRQAVKRVTFPTESGPFQITVSIGVSEPDLGDKSISNALERSDAALYSAKRNGRDRAEISVEPKTAPEDLYDNVHRIQASR